MDVPPEAAVQTKVAIIISDPHLLVRPACLRLVAGSARPSVVIVSQVHMRCFTHLLKVRDAHGCLRRDLRLREYGHENGCQNRDDRDHHKQLDKCKTTFDCLHVYLLSIRTYDP